MSAPRLGLLRRTVPSNRRDFEFVADGEEYQDLIRQSLAESPGVSSFVCNGAVPAKMDITATVNHSLIGRGLIKSYVTDAYNVACDHFPHDKKLVEHCLFRTVGETGHVLDYDDRVWPNNSAGAYISFITSNEKRSTVLDTTDQILSGSDAKPEQKAFLDALLLPLVQNWSGPELNCEAMMYIKLVFSGLGNVISSEAFIGVRDAVSKITELDDLFAANLLALIAVEMNLPIPTYMPREGAVHNYAQSMIPIMTGIIRDDPHLTLSKFYKALIESVEDLSRSGLLIALFLDSYLSWGGDDEELEEFADKLEEDEEVPQPINFSEIQEHRAVTSDTILGAPSITDPLVVPGGKLMPAELGEISTVDLSGRKVGTVDKRRIVAYIDNGQLTVQFKNARNYLLNALHFVRPGSFVSTEVREEIIDRDKLVGLPALHLLLRGRTSRRLARFIMAALTYKAISVKLCDSSAISMVLGDEEGDLRYGGVASPSVLSALPVLIDEENRLYLYHDGRTYRLQLRGMAWNISKEDMNSTPTGFGNLSTPYPLK